MPKAEETPSLTLETVTGIARRETLKHGGHVPLLMVQGDAQALMLPLTEMAETAKERAQQMFITGLMLARSGEVGVLQQVFLITEGWLRVVEGGALPDKPASQDPERKEVLTVTQLNLATGKTQMTITEMLRDEEGELTTLTAPDWHTGLGETQAESPLLNAFVLGFLGLTKEVND